MWQFLVLIYYGGKDNVIFLSVMTLSLILHISV